jgi:hypothetical protein
MTMNTNGFVAGYLSRQKAGMNVQRTLRLAAIFAAIHLVAATGSLLLGFSLGMARFDSPETSAPGYTEAASSRLADVLFAPAQMIYRALHAGSSAPAMVQWLYMILNSALWGLVLAAAVMWLRSRRGAK